MPPFARRADAFHVDRPLQDVNDTLGHPIGDALLRQVADRLKSVMGNHGQVGRLGGDEFQAVLPGTVGIGLLILLRGR